MSPSLNDIESAIRAAGLTPRGAFYPTADDQVPDLADDQPARTVILVGNAGPAMWQAFSAAPQSAQHPLDQWCDTVISDLAIDLGAEALFPFTRPPMPFQRWARRAEPCYSSPLGILVHPRHGLWHAYRGALAFAAIIDVPQPRTAENPCHSCADKPCLDTCPVDAFDGNGYDVPACVAHVETRAGADCMTYGCRARRACPVGRESVYDPAQAAFHMRAFLRARQAARRAENTAKGA